MTRCEHNPMFRVNDLAYCLDRVNVKYEIVEGAILIDTEALSKINVYDMPHLLYMNYKWIMGCVE